MSQRIALQRRRECRLSRACARARSRLSIARDARGKTRCSSSRFLSLHTGLHQPGGRHDFPEVRHCTPRGSSRRSPRLASPRSAHDCLRLYSGACFLSPARCADFTTRISAVGSCYGIRRSRTLSVLSC